MKRMSVLVILGLLVFALCSLVLNQTKLLGEGPAKAPVGSPTKQLTLDLGKGVAMKLALIPAGKFLMGSPEGEEGRQPNEGPQHEVTISKPFHMGVYEVTQGQYEAVMGKNPSTLKGEMNPVGVSWHGAAEFCKKLSAKTGKVVRLPTEAEWEYACRAGTKTRFSFGDAYADLHKYGNYADKSNTSAGEKRDKEHDDGRDKIAPVGSYKPNTWGLYDMHGNVWEWCGDWYAESYATGGTRNPQGPGSGTLRVLRGGCWMNHPQLCRSAFRGAEHPDLSLSAEDPKSKITTQKLQATMVKMEFENQELGLIIDYLRETTDLPLHVKWRALEAAEITPRTTVNIKIRNVTAAKALEILLGDLSAGEKKLKYKVDEGLVVISTATDFEGDSKRMIEPTTSFVGFRVVVSAAGMD